jgi:hypothetical protein
MMIYAGHVERMGEMRKACSILVRKPEGKTPLGRPSRRWVSNFRTGLRELGWEVVDWMHLARYKDQWGAVVNTVMKTRVL